MRLKHVVGFLDKIQSNNSVNCNWLKSFFVGTLNMQFQVI